MSKHDSWVKLAPDSPFKAIEHLFPKGFPVRDPFPMGKTTDETGEKIALWYIDIERLTEPQLDALCACYAAKMCQKHDLESGAITHEDILQQIKKAKTLRLNHDHVIALEGGEESMARTKELHQFFLKNPEPDAATWKVFMDNQIARWVEGDEIPPPINSLSDIPEDLIVTGTEEALLKNRVNQKLQGMNMFDVLTGGMTAAVAESIEELNLPNRDYSLDFEIEPTVGYGVSYSNSEVEIYHKNDNEVNYDDN